MKGPTPKPPELLQRRNRSPTGALLATEAEAATWKVPPLPERDPLPATGKPEPWHPRVVEWWEALWTSPMAGQYLNADVKGGLHLLAELHQRRWTETATGALVSLAAEIRHQEIRFGLSPIDRRRLQWEIERAEVPEASVDKRRAAAAPAPRMPARKDPRGILRIG